MFDQRTVLTLLRDLTSRESRCIKILKMGSDTIYDLSFEVLETWRYLGNQALVKL